MFLPLSNTIGINIMKKIIISLMLTLSLINATTITTQKTNYSIGDNIIISYSDMLGDSEDWIGIYEKGSSTDWENMKKWDWTDGKANGTLSLGTDGLAPGDYEIRAFFENLFNIEASFDISIQNNNIETSVSSNKVSYIAGESIDITYSNMLGDSEDWIGIYEKGSSTDWENMKKWDWTKGTPDGTLTLDTNDLAAGEYEVRAFFDNKFEIKASFDISISEITQDTFRTDEAKITIT